MIKSSINARVALSAITAAGLFSASAGEDLGKAPIGKEPLIIDDEAPELLTFSIDSRLRYETGDQDGSDVSHSGTWRNRIGVLTREMGGFQIFGEYEGTLAVDRGSYNAVVHGDPSKTVLVDPESHEANQFWVSYSAPDFMGAKIKAGRQAINLDGQRFVGGVAWRQNMQTFDAATVTFAPVEGGQLFYSYVNRVNRIFGSEADESGPAAVTDFEGNTHLVNFSYDLPFGKLTTYAYFMDLGNDAGDANSNNTFGASLAGKIGGSPLGYYTEYAYQTDSFDSPLEYETNYAHGSLSLPLGETGVTVTAGLEYLGSDNGVGFKTPLATLHKFNGFADRFLASTPGTGLTDLYVSIAKPLPFKLKAAAFYHYFQDDEFDVEYGNEIDFVLTRPINEKLSALAKYAYFDGTGAAGPDIQRFTLELNYKF